MATTQTPPAASTPGNEENKRTIATAVAIFSNVTPEDVMTGFNVKTPASKSETDAESSVHVTDLTKEHWSKIITASGVLKAWKGQYEGGEMHINRAPCAAFALNSQSLDEEPGQESEVIPEFEIADDTYVETTESTTSLEREMTLKAFTDSSIHAALSGGAQGIGIGLGGEVSWQKDHENLTTNRVSSASIHGFYNDLHFPRVIIHLNPDGLKLSRQCVNFFAKHSPMPQNNDEKDLILKKFFDRFGAILACRVTLGGRLCTTQERQSDDQDAISRQKHQLKTQLTATVTGAGLGADAGISHQKGSESLDHRFAQEEKGRMTLETQGGDGLLASSLPDWIASVKSYRNWRTIQQNQPEDIFSILTEVSAGTDIESSVKELAQYGQKQLYKMHRYRSNYLDISVTASLSMKEVPKRVVGTIDPSTGSLVYGAAKTTTQPAFSIMINISQPSVVRLLDTHYYVNISEWERAGRTNPWDWKRDPSYRKSRDKIEENIALLIDLGPEESPGVDHKLKQACSLRIYVVLEDFAIWGQGAQQFKNWQSNEFDQLNNWNFGEDAANMKFLHEQDAIRLDWPDLQVNSKMRWEIPISRVLQQNERLPINQLERRPDLKEDKSSKVEKTDSSKMSIFKKKHASESA